MKFFDAEFIDRDQLCVIYPFLEYFHSAEVWSSRDQNDRGYIGTFEKRLHIVETCLESWVVHVSGINGRR